MSRSYFRCPFASVTRKGGRTESHKAHRRAMNMAVAGGMVETASDLPHLDEVRDVWSLEDDYRFAWLFRSEDSRRPIYCK